VWNRRRSVRRNTVTIQVTANPPADLPRPTILRYVNRRFHVENSAIIEPSAYAENPIDHKAPGNGIPDNRGVKVNPERIKKAKNTSMLVLELRKHIVILNFSMECRRLCEPVSKRVTAQSMSTIGVMYSIGVQIYVYNVDIELVICR